MDSAKTHLVPRGIFQAIGLALCFTCLWGIMNSLGSFPSTPVSLSNEYGESITFAIPSFSYIINVLMGIFWVIIGYSCFSRKCVLGATGAVLCLAACIASLMIYVTYCRMAAPDADYYQARQALETGQLLSYIDTVCYFAGILLIAVKGRISVALKAAFILYPAVAFIAYSFLAGHEWYIWFQTVYAIGLTVWSFNDKSNQ